MTPLAVIKFWLSELLGAKYCKTEMLNDEMSFVH
jgi:hypothetical protein